MRVSLQTLPRPVRVSLQVLPRTVRVSLQTLPRTVRVSLQTLPRTVRVSLQTLPRTVRVSLQTLPRTVRVSLQTLPRIGGESFTLIFTKLAKKHKMMVSIVLDLHTVASEYNNYCGVYSLDEKFRFFFTDEVSVDTCRMSTYCYIG